MWLFFSLFLVNVFIIWLIRTASEDTLIQVIPYWFIDYSILLHLFESKEDSHWCFNNWGYCYYCHYCMTYLLQQWFPMTIMCLGLKNWALIFHSCQLIEAVLCMEPSTMIRYGSCCISAPACEMPVVEVIVMV